MSVKILKLISAIENGDRDKVISVLKPGFLKKAANVNERIFGGKTALMTAVQKGDAEIIKILLNVGAEVNDGDTRKKTALMYADTRLVAEMLLHSGADIDAKNDDDKTPLMTAIEDGNLEIVKLLLDEGADVNARTKDRKVERETFLGNFGHDKTTFLEDKTALMLATEQGRIEMVILILDRKPEINFRNRLGKTALIKALERNDAAVAKLLAVAGTEVNLPDIIYHLQRSSLPPESVVKFIRLFLDIGADVNAKDSSGATALMKAMRLHNLAAVQLLVESGAGINLLDAGENTALFYLASEGELEDEAVLEYMIKKGLDVNVRNSLGKYPFINSPRALYTFSRILIQAGVQYVPGDNHALFMEAIDKKDGLIVEHLLKNGAETEWEEQRQAEDVWGRISVSDRYDMLAYAKGRNVPDIVQLIQQYMRA